MPDLIRTVFRARTGIARALLVLLPIVIAACQKNGGGSGPGY